METKKVSIDFVLWIQVRGWKFNAKKKHPNYWILFKGRGAGYTKETTESLYDRFFEDYYRTLPPSAVKTTKCQLCGGFVCVKDCPNV